MDVSNFLINAKTGLIDLKPTKMISNKGGIEDIRKRTKAQLRDAGFNTYSMLGSQNAISAEPEKGNKIEIDIEIAEEPAPAPEPKEKEILPGGTQKKPLIGGTGGKQSEKSKEQSEERKRDEAKEPNDRPPFDLSSAEGKKELQIYKEYLKMRYGKDVGRMKVDELEKDSQGFTVALKAWREINKQISAFNKDDARRWTEWANNTFVKFGNEIIDALSFGATVLAPEAKGAIDSIKKLLKQFKPTNEKDFVGSMKELQHKLFEGKPEWKSKLNAISKKAFDEFTKKIEKTFGLDEGLPPGVDKSKVPFGGM